MKTTLDIADPLAADARREARAQGTTFRALVEEGLRRLLADRRRGRAQPFHLRDASVSGRGVSPELEEGRWGSIRDLVYPVPATRTPKRTRRRR